MKTGRMKVKNESIWSKIADLYKAKYVIHFHVTIDDF